jgi:sporulation-control protein spo0M
VKIIVSDHRVYLKLRLDMTGGLEDFEKAIVKASAKRLLEGVIKTLEVVEEK